MDLGDAQWEILQPVFVEPRRADWKGLPWRDARAVLNGVLWILRTGAQWQDLPDRYPPSNLPSLFSAMAVGRTFRSDFAEVGPGPVGTRGGSISVRGPIDATFSGAKKGALELAQQSTAKGARSWQSQTALVFLSPCMWPALHRHETRLVEATLQQSFAPHPPEKLMGTGPTPATLWISG